MSERTAWQRFGWIARWLGTAIGVAYVLHRVSFADVSAAAGRISAPAFALACALIALNVVCGAWRWRVLLRAYGAETRPSLARCTKLYFVAFFYNNYLPGAVAGDVVRGVATRESFGEHGTTGALAVVLVERALGLFGVFLLLAIGLRVADAADIGSRTSSLWLWSGVGIAGSFALVLALPFSRAIARRLPLGRVRTIAERVPELRDGRAFAVATLLSIATQAFVALAGYTLLHAVDPRVGLGGSLLIVPLAAATTFLPITVGGAGAREAVYVALGASLFAMPEGDALAASLALWLAHLANGAVGGVLQLTER